MPGNGRWDRWELLETAFAAAALLLPSFAPWRTGAYLASAGVALAAAAAVLWWRPFADWLGVDERPDWPFTSRTLSAIGFWVVAAGAVSLAFGVPSVREATGSRRGGQAFLVGAVALLLYSHLVAAAVWRWTLVRRARRLGPGAEREARRLVSEHERGHLTSTELRAAWKELAGRRPALPPP